MKHSLHNQWDIWFTYVTEEQQKQNQYCDHLDKVYHIGSVEDLAYLWTQSHVSSLDNFFVSLKEQEPKCWQYEIKNQLQIINSINYFKENIQPKWEDKANANGGRLIFQIQRSQANYQQIYQALVFYFIGENFQNSQIINGIRFISAKPKTIQRSFYRVQIWVNCDQSQTQKVQQLKESFLPFLEKYHINNLKPFFKENKETKK